MGCGSLSKFVGSGPSDGQNEIADPRERQIAEAKTWETAEKGWDPGLARWRVCGIGPGEKDTIVQH